MKPPLCSNLCFLNSSQNSAWRKDHGEVKSSSTERLIKTAMFLTNLKPFLVHNFQVSMVILDGYSKTGAHIRLSLVQGHSQIRVFFSKKIFYCMHAQHVIFVVLYWRICPFICLFLVCMFFCLYIFLFPYLIFLRYMDSLSLLYSKCTMTIWQDSWTPNSGEFHIFGVAVSVLCWDNFHWIVI